MLKKILLEGIKIYQLCLRPYLGKNCRFWPSCSDYAQQAIMKYGAFKGVGKLLKRLMICQPLSSKQGYLPLE